MPDIAAALRYSADHRWVRPDPGTSLVRAAWTKSGWRPGVCRPVTAGRRTSFSGTFRHGA